MDVSEENLILIEKIRKFRDCKETEETLKHENELLEEKDEYKEALIDLRSEMIDRKNLLEQVKT